MIVIGIDPGKNGAVAVWDEGIDKITKCPATIEKMVETIKRPSGPSYQRQETKVFIERNGRVDRRFIIST